MQDLRRKSMAKLQSTVLIQGTVSHSNKLIAVRCNIPSASIRQDEASPQQGPRQYKTGRNNCQHLLNSGTVD